jgi:crossover junction endodeoxyribonuclease RuvC
METRHRAASYKLFPGPGGPATYRNVLTLGIDPGTRHLGWGLVRRDASRIVHVAHGVIDLDARHSLAVRLRHIDERLGALIEEYRPDVGSVETLFFFKDASAAAKLGHARGVVLAALARHDVAVAEYAPAHVKRTIAGRGQASKGQVAQMVTALLSLAEPPRADAADALALALTHLRAANGVASLPVGGRLRGALRGGGKARLRALVAERGRRSG